jgi:GNAT superfamily N-acetyltransferase
MYLIAWLDGMPVGHLLLKWPGAPPPARAFLDPPTLSDISVHPEHQSRGIGSQLMECAEHLAVQSGYHQASLCVATDNARARVLYERRGYRNTAGTHLSRWSYLDERGDERCREEVHVRLLKSLAEQAT